jgi:DNA-binding response OmpR family regulator
VPDVLIATDADWIFDEVAAALTDEGTDVVRVRAGKEVREAVRRVQPGLVVLDLQIGNMGGIATAISLQQDAESDSAPPAPILLLLDRPADVPMAHRTGVQGWLVKPLDAFRLRRASRSLAVGDTYFEPSGLTSA